MKKISPQNVVKAQIIKKFPEIRQLDDGTLVILKEDGYYILKPEEKRKWL